VGKKKKATARRGPVRKRRKQSKVDDLEYIEGSIRHLAVSIGSVKPDAQNLRKHSQRNLDVIRRSLADFRQQTPIVRDADGVIRKGNGTLEAALALGWTHVAVVDSTLRGQAAKMYAVADNRSGDPEVGSEWADEALAEFLASVTETDDLDVTATGFELEEIQELVNAAVGDLEETEKKRQGEAKVEEKYAVMVTCKGEDDQRAVYELMEDRGYKCRVLTL
jgi:hypothetical protein